MITSSIIIILFGAGLSFSGGFDWVIDMYSCLYDVDIYKKNTEDVYQILASATFNEKHPIVFTTYDEWVISKIQNSLKLDLSNDAYILEKSFMEVNFNKDGIEKIVDESKNVFSILNDSKDVEVVDTSSKDIVVKNTYIKLYDDDSIDNC